ncbi:hypothetical protein DH2020_014205 [Rehmannia glutinosa]|uniref:Cyclic nucleotide-binding domain-containing protein n=1 Tax=Rehmannia glutinosa TaxID=99300 RepID=A0ABR0WZC5_REHGL
MRKGSQGLKSIGRSLGFGVSRAVFPEDLKVSEKKIFDPQDKLLTIWNKLFVMSCILGVSVDPLFFFLPVLNKSSNCLDIDRKLAITATTLRTIVDAFYLIHMALQFRTAYIAPSSRVFGRGELVIDPAQIAKRYLKCYFIIDFLAVLPLPQIVVWRFLQRSKGSDVLATKQALFFIILLQYIPRFARILPLTSELKRTSGVFAETAWAGAVSYLLLYMLASHIVGALWYILSVERNDTCWQRACKRSGRCNTDFLYYGNQKMNGYNIWSNISDSVLSLACPVDDDNNPPFDFGIFRQALESGIVSSKTFLSKYCYCLWWGLQNLRSDKDKVIAQSSVQVSGFLLALFRRWGMFTCIVPCAVTIAVVIWFGIRSVKACTLGQGLQTSTYPGESIFSIALAIFGLILFALLIGNMQVPLFENMDERLLDAICERLKPCLYTENTYIVREGDPVDEMIFSYAPSREHPKSGSNLPSSTRTVKALTEVEAFALTADELKFVASQFRRLHSRQVQHTFRFYSQQWRTWAACFIQAAWRRYSKRKILEMRRKEEEEAEGLAGASGNAGGGSYSIGATFLASRFAANALRGVHRNRNLKSARSW